jgi:protein-S-isoprenylcysteine O-methyltransferase Ste14
MKRVMFFAYGVVAYAIFLVTILYAIGFVANIIVPKSVDTGWQGGEGMGWLVNCLLLSLFAIQHSVMARPGFKRVWTRLVPKPIERSTYVHFSNAALIALFWFWRPMTGIVWRVADQPAAGILTGLSFSGWGIVLLGSFLISHFDLFGVAQVYQALRNREYRYPTYMRPFLYKIVRHPMMVGFIVAFWATPLMTVGHLLFASASTAYILVAIQLEERDLVRYLGTEYERYQREVPQIIPMLPRRKQPEGVAAGTGSGK